MGTPKWLLWSLGLAGAGTATFFAVRAYAEKKKAMSGASSAMTPAPNALVATEISSSVSTPEPVSTGPVFTEQQAACDAAKKLEGTWEEFDHWFGSSSADEKKAQAILREAHAHAYELCGAQGSPPSAETRAYWAKLIAAADEAEESQVIAAEAAWLSAGYNPSTKLSGLRGWWMR